MDEPVDAVPSQSTAGDRRSLAACQRAIRRRAGRYTYLEVGSHLGGSLLPHVQDPSCRAMWSIDSRPAVQPDARGSRFAYPGNSSTAMVERLRQSDTDITRRLTCLDTSVTDVDPNIITPRPELCFIDGEHTDQAVAADYAFCRGVLAQNGLIVFHDASVVYNALAAIISRLDAGGLPYRAAVLPDTVFVLEFGTWDLINGPEIAEASRDGYRAYLFSLQSNDVFRRLANRWPLRLYRKLRALGQSVPLC